MLDLKATYWDGDRIVTLGRHHLCKNDENPVICLRSEGPEGEDMATPMYSHKPYYQYIRKVVTQHVNPPIPERSHDWKAWLDGDEETGSYGNDETEASAIDDLATILVDL